MPKADSSGVSIHYQVHGEGPPLLLIMGFGQSGDMWIPVLPYLEGFRAVFFDNRGTGRSDRPERGYTVADMARDALAVLDAAGIERAHVYGVSMGGMIAQQLALDAPERIDRLVLGCTTAGLSAATFPDPEVPLRLVRAAEAMSRNPRESVELLLPLLFPPEFLEGNPAVAQMLEMAIAANPTPPETPAKVMEGIMTFDAAPRLGEVRAPTLVVHGDRDVILPVENGRELARRIPGARYLEIPGAGHAFMVQDPGGVHEKIVAFLRET
ncbi:MAG: alpha/beta fold hydrolase [Candidatus Dadabacteria bacterium]|nr:MAG: alpha/beta fold hydrolase [Candidatus Dadabacteria bacterium]